jgi:succinyl-diaminopimelate desuccinylase
MKSGLTILAVAIGKCTAANPSHPGTLVVLLSSDKVGDAIDGVCHVARVFAERGQCIDWCITGEPSSTAVLGDLLRVGRRGSLTGTLTVRGVQGHVAYPDKASNPIHLAAPALAELTARRWDEGYETFPPTSLQVSNINAGTGASNVIPGTLEVMFNLRYTPLWNAQKLETEIHALFDAHALDYSIKWHRSGEPFYTPEGRLRAVAREVLGQFAGGAPVESTGGGTSDARFIAPLGAQCIEVGPVNATIHQVDECVRVEELERLPDLYRQLIERLLD